MKITMIGSGYVGLVTGACFAEVGNDVLCFDIDERKIDILQNGGVPIHEPGLQEMIARNVAAGRLHFSTDIDHAVAFGALQFIAVGTPPGEDGSADMQYVLEAARNIGRRMNEWKIIVDKSTVPVGTADRVRAVITEELEKRRSKAEFTVVSNPEFLKEGAAIDDFMRPDRIVIGTDHAQAARTMRELYAPFQRNHERLLTMDVRSAEFTKYAANAMLATRISFMNELANLADRLEVDIEMVRRGIGSDPRIGYDFLYAGSGYGGSCFPKDVKALLRTASQAGSPLHVLAAVERANERQKHVLIEKICARLGDDLSGCKFALWGLAFKPNTDDMREAPARVVVRELLQRRAQVVAYDPVAMEEARRVFAQEGLSVAYADSAMEAVRGADALVLMTEWKAFRSPDFAALRQLLKTPLLFDGRNIYDPRSVRDAGLEYFGIGRR
ncbi:MAG: UDP-glucose/GDP-mannose dehydrogenase family protein [Proteobacteria bacterium]|nr:UDP-glucose/GDP-mannose dehydrogenase family protein [Pseudomonadota bacterium]MCL2307263.1 UDP-glucose/GDP-mannose dehydrogenase family protein [Pseudomonadota bacterium]